MNARLVEFKNLTHRVHGSRLQIHEDRTRHIAAASSFVVVHVDALELQVGVTVVRPRGVDTFFQSLHRQIIVAADKSRPSRLFDALLNRCSSVPSLLVAAFRVFFPL